VVGVVVMQRPRRLSSEYDLVEPDHQRAQVQSLAHPRLEVARAMKLVVQPARAERIGIRGKLVAAAAGFQRVERRLCGEHARLDRGMAALDARSVEESRVVADQAAAGKNEAGQGLQAARVDGAGAVAEALAAFQEMPDRGVRLIALEFLVRIE